MTGTAPLLEVTGLTVDLPGADGELRRVVHGLDLTVAAGERVALVGESGSGKSVTAAAVLQLMGEARLGGSVRLGGRELLGMPARELRRVRGAQVGMVFQDPLTALDPVIRVVDQVAEVLVVHGSRRRPARDRAREVLDALGVLGRLPRGDGYPHELSGGMRQRVGIAMAVVAEPALLIADEPTTALDVRVQEQVLTLLDDLTRERGTAVLLITHDLGIVAGFAERVAVMRSGRLVETAGVDQLFAAPEADYTAQLLAAVPRIDAVLPEEPR
jgi:ABC-type dipeptide/oligopeptide/nickel transport system ATPase component